MVLNAVQPSVGLEGLEQERSSCQRRPVRCRTRRAPAGAGTVARCFAAALPVRAWVGAVPALGLWEHPRGTPTPAGQSHPQQTHGGALPSRVYRALLQPGSPGAPPPPALRPPPRPPVGRQRGAAGRSPARSAGRRLGKLRQAAGMEGGGGGGASGQPGTGPPGVEGGRVGG